MDNEDDEEELVVPEITALQLTDQLAGENPPYLLDVREDWEVARGMIPGGVHIAMNTVPDHLAEIPTDRPVVVYCASGARSYAVAGYLLQNGFTDVKNLDSGIQGWAMVQRSRK
jgi:rhodanese-related sulfurtransferase